MKSQILSIVKRVGNNSIFSSFLNLSSINVSNILLLILLHPILNRKIGEAYGMFIVANQFAMLLGIIINYGTNQSGIKDIALAKDDKEQRAIEFYNVLVVRALIFVFFAIMMLVGNSMNIHNYSYFFLAVPLMFAEVINPLFLYIGIERLIMFNILNVSIKLAVILSVIFFINGPGDAERVNLFIGVIHIIGYFFLIIYASVKFGLPLRIRLLNYTELLKSNFYLVSNGVSVHLQQSLMVFAIYRWGSAGWLTAYSVGDKIIWSVRLLIISISSAIYPRAALVYNESKQSFINMKDRYNKLLALCFGMLSLTFLIFAPIIVRIYTGEDNQMAVLFLRLMSFSPLLAALNALNILHLLITNQNKQILKIGLLLLITSLCLSGFAIYSMHIFLVGIYAAVMEGLALIYYTKRLSMDKYGDSRY